MINSSEIYIVFQRDKSIDEGMYYKKRGFTRYDDAERYFYSIIGKTYMEILYDDNKKEDNGYAEDLEEISMITGGGIHTSLDIGDNTIEKYVNFGWTEFSIVKIPME